jgi:hypothetical protein
MDLLVDFLLVLWIAACIFTLFLIPIIVIDWIKGEK